MRLMGCLKSICGAKSIPTIEIPSGATTFSISDSSNVFFLNPAAGVTIATIQAAQITPGRRVTFIHIGESGLTVAFTSNGGSTTALEFDGGANVTLDQNDTLEVMMNHKGVWLEVSTSNNG